MTATTKASEVKVYDLETKELKAIVPAYTEKELKVVINKDMPHSNSMSQRIKTDEVLLAKYLANRTKYIEDYEATKSQMGLGINSTDLDGRD